MPKIKTILVPVDTGQTETVAPALALAKENAAAHGAGLVLLNVIEQVPGYVVAQLPKGYHEAALAEAEAQLKALVAEHDLPADTGLVVREGHAPTEILEYAREAGIDLIVIASHEPGAAHFFLGSVAARVVRHAHCSVLVVREHDG